LAGVKFLLKKERVFFFRGSALQVFGQCGGAKCGLGFAKLFSGDLDLAKPRLTFVFAFCPRGGGVWGGIRAGFFAFLAGYLWITLAFFILICYHLNVYANERHPEN
jgi:hypothetical protein